MRVALVKGNVRRRRIGGREGGAMQARLFLLTVEWTFKVRWGVFADWSQNHITG